MDGPRDYHTKWSKSDKDKYHTMQQIFPRAFLPQNENLCLHKNAQSHFIFISPNLQTPQMSLRRCTAKPSTVSSHCGYCSAVRSNQLLIHTTTTEMHLQRIILIEKKPVPKGEMLYEAISISWVAQSCLTLCDPLDCSTPGFPVQHQLPEPT